MAVSGLTDGVECVGIGVAERRNGSSGSALSSRSRTGSIRSVVLKQRETESSAYRQSALRLSAPPVGGAGLSLDIEAV